MSEYRLVTYGHDYDESRCHTVIKKGDVVLDEEDIVAELRELEEQVAEARCVADILLAHLRAIERAAKDANTLEEKCAWLGDSDG